MNWVEIGRGSGKDENRVKVGWVEGGRYFVGGFIVGYLIFVGSLLFVILVMYIDGILLLEEIL